VHVVSEAQCATSLQAGLIKFQLVIASFLVPQVLDGGGQRLKVFKDALNITSFITAPCHRYLMTKDDVETFFLTGLNCNMLFS